MERLADEQIVRERVRRIVAEMAPVQRAEVSGATELTVDLGYDSLTLMELATLLERKFDLSEVREDDAVEAETVADVQVLVLRMLELASAT
jgi:acyl carrier protein